MPLSRMTSLLNRGQRTAVVGRTAVHVFLRYKRAQRRIATLPSDQRDAAWDRQHRESAGEIATRAKRLRGLYIKSAQFLGARADLLPEPYIAALSQLHDRVPPQSYATIRPVLREALGAEPEQVFAAFERRPVAAASLAQVHRARLRDGRSVAVKVQYPDIGRLVELDLRNLTTILGLVHRFERGLDFRPIARAVGRLVPQELDFINEGRSAETIIAALAHRGDVVAPAVVWEHTSGRVLVTEYVDGAKVSDVAALRAMGLDPREVAERVVDVWGEQVLGHGFFHGDPHPGNIIVLADGRLSLIDFGLTARLTPAAREGVARLSIAAANRDPIAVMDAFRAMGFIAHDDSPVAFVGLSSRMMGTEGGIDDVNTRLAQALRGFNIEGVPPEVLLVMRVQGLLKGLSTLLGRPGPVMPVWRPYAERQVAAASD